MAPKVPLLGLWKVVQFWQEWHSEFKCFCLRGKRDVCQEHLPKEGGTPLEKATESLMCHSLSHSQRTRRLGESESIVLAERHRKRIGKRERWRMLQLVLVATTLIFVLRVWHPVQRSICGLHESVFLVQQWLCPLQVDKWFGLEHTQTLLVPLIVNVHPVLQLWTGLDRASRAGQLQIDGVHAAFLGQARVFGQGRE